MFVSTLMIAAAISLASPADASGGLPDPHARPRSMGGGGGDALPPFDSVSEDHEAVISSADGNPGLYTLYRREKDDHLLIELPAGFENQPILIAYTVAGGVDTSGVQLGDQFAHWLRIRDRLLLVEPNLAVQTSGDFESQQGYGRVFTDKVLLDVPVLSEGPGGGPVIDGTSLFLHGAGEFFGGALRGARTDLGTIHKAKSYPENVELAFDLPLRSGRFGTIYYSIRSIPEDGDYQPREEDHRIGYFTTSHRDIGDPSDDDPWVRFINRWDLEKADPSLKTSPPKEPIVFFMEHTIPVRYRRWVRDGILEWNKAFEQVGIVNAIEVYQQDARTGAHMEKDPEDARYNFLLWTNANMGFAIGPSRVDPRTGKILDADIVMDEGFIRGWVGSWRKLIPETVMESFDLETRAWLRDHPDWDPRVRLAPPSMRKDVLAEIAATAENHPAMLSDSSLIGDQEYDGLWGRTSQVNGACLNTMIQSYELGLARMHPDILMMLDDEGDDADGDDGGEGDDDDADASDEEDEDGPDMLDGVPDWFIGPMLRDVIMHEVGHTLGLRHNFKASTVYGMAEMNDETFEPEAICGSVMEYSPININVDDGPQQGDFTMMTIGPYDFWAIEYGYTSEDDGLGDILSRVNEPQLAYATDEDTFSSDPTARRFDWAKNPLDYAESQVRLVQLLRETLLDRMVEDGESWAKARAGYEMLLWRQSSAVSQAADWIGGVIQNRSRKGDPGDRDPNEEIAPDVQRRALSIVLKNSFRDDAFGLSPELLRKMTVEKRWDESDFMSVFDDPSWPIHDRIGGIQATALTLLLNPGTLGDVYDGEFRIPADQDAFSMAELMAAVSDEVWSELADPSASGTIRSPAISNLRRNLQVEHLGRLIELSLEQSTRSPARRTMQSLSRQQLRDIAGRIDAVSINGLDPYTAAHLAEASQRIDKALNADFAYGGGGGGGLSIIDLLFGRANRPVE